MSNNKKTLTLVEGRKVNYRTIRDLREETAKAGWGFLLVEDFDRERKAKCDFRDGFSNYVIWRDLDFTTSAVDTMRVLEWLNKNEDIITINTHSVGGRAWSSDKYYQHALYGMDDYLKPFTPIVRMVRDKEDVRNLVKEGLLKYPLVLKDCLGTTGKGISLIPNEEYLMSKHIKEGTWNRIMVEPYIYGDYEWRVFVVGGTAVGFMRKEIDNGAGAGDFVAKSAGKGKAKEEDPKIMHDLARIACHMVADLGLEYGGCDIIRSQRGHYYVLETNNSAGWQNSFNKITGLNMGQILISWFDDMSVLKEKGFYAGVKTYVENRIKYLFKDNRDKYESIINWTDKTKKAQGDSLAARLQNQYYEILHGADIKEAKNLIDEVERTPLCWAGNFIGSHTWGKDGVLEECLEPTAYYLAIREKYDKIAKVN